MDKVCEYCGSGLSDATVRRPVVVVKLDRRPVGNIMMDGEWQVFGEHAMCVACQERLYQGLLDCMKKFVDESPLKHAKNEADKA